MEPAGLTPCTDPPLSYLRPVPRHLVHRAAISEVFITDARRGACGFQVAAQWPRDHTLYHPDPAGYADPLLCAETMRQALVYLAHEHAGIPVGHRFIGRSLGFALTRPEAMITAGHPLPVRLDVAWTRRDRQAGGPAEVRLEAEISVDGVSCGDGFIEVLIVDERRYTLLRRRGAALANAASGGTARRTDAGGPFQSVPLCATGRSRAKDCLLEQSSDGRRWRMRVDRNHPVLFDHPTDHVPLMATLEGFRQLGHLITRSYTRRDAGTAGLTAVRIECEGWGELDLPVDLVVEAGESGTGGTDGRRPLRMSALQAGVRLAGATLEWTERNATMSAHVDSLATAVSETTHQDAGSTVGRPGALTPSRVADPAPSRIDRGTGLAA
jgi:hypothetical protein